MIPVPTSFSQSALLESLTLGQTCRHYPSGSFIYVAGPDSHNLYLIESGYVRLGYYQRSGQESLHGIIRPGGLLGDLSGQSHSANEFAQALSPVRVYVLCRSQFLQAVGQQPALLEYVLQQMQTRLQHMEAHLHLSRTGDAYTRVVRCIGYLADLCGQRFGDRIHLENLFTQADIALMIGVSRQSVCTILTEMKQNGYIDYRRRRLRLTPSFHRLASELN
jgi:CRP/FNR family transcriptional regulator, cyclic AMP receptor protein